MQMKDIIQGKSERTTAEQALLEELSSLVSAAPHAPEALQVDPVEQKVLAFLHVSRSAAKTLEARSNGLMGGRLRKVVPRPNSQMAIP